MVNAVGARVDARVWAAMRRAQRAKEASAALNAARAKAKLNGGSSVKKLPANSGSNAQPKAKQDAPAPRD